MTPIVHLHWAKSAELMRGVTSGFAVCGARDLPREQLTAFPDDTTCKTCIVRHAAEEKGK
jgi:hypothetical protein